MKQGSFTIEENRPLTATVSRLRLRGDCSAIESPGQFAALSLPGFFLRRPFSVCDWTEESLSLVYDAVGRGTEALRALAPGAELDGLTGLGNGFDLSRAGELPLLIGGGTGASPLPGLARRLIAQGAAPRAILGFGTAAQVILAEELEALGCPVTLTTADGSAGRRGLVTDAMEGAYSFFYACGPEAMLRAAAEKSAAAGQMSFEARMGCGFGACMGCTRQTKSGPRRVCRDGPVFDKEEILWDD